MLSASDGDKTATTSIHVQVDQAHGAAFGDWLTRHFSPDQLNDPGIAGPDADPDGDGHTNRQEFRSQTDPLDPSSVLRILAVSRLSPNAVRLEFAARPGLVYAIETRQSLQGGAWQAIDTLTAENDTESYIDEAPDAPNGRYYRIRTAFPSQP